MDFWKHVLNTVVIGPKFLLGWSALSVVFLLYLVFKHRKTRWFFYAAGSLLLGLGLGLGLLWYLQDVDNTFGEPFLKQVWIWAPAAFAGVALAILNLKGGRWWRSVVAGVSAVVFLVTAAFQINAAYGLNPTLASLLDIDTANVVTLSPRSTWDTSDASQALYKRWVAPTGIPTEGQQGKTLAPIPATHSNFPARRSGLYLPPAALVKNPPLLPFVIMMMGQPGSPDPTSIASVADAMAAKHHGLAPVILVVDQLGDPMKDPLCLNTSRGQVETYVMKDVVPWARANLPIQQDRRFWTFMGYSNGGVCAAYFGTKYPKVFGSYASVSGEEFQGSEKPAYTLASVFNGDQAAYNAVKPRNIMTAHHRYADTVAVYTVGSEDPRYLAAAKRSVATARSVGINVSFRVIPGAGHVGNAVVGGLSEAFGVLYPRWGLSAP
ncbi:alpha/beta hydrolase [Arthrobacter sp. RCC_34]|uniref:alpha/beta hydrolase n=1 Tax=Arthrobacter sp. RCC_34 TaxID=3239230 RepID=UPI003524DAB1